MACFSHHRAHVLLPVGRHRQAVARVGPGVSEKMSRWAVWDVGRAGAVLQEGFQTGGLLGRGLRGVTLGMAPFVLHLYLYSALHPGELLGLAMGCGGSSVGLAGVGGVGGTLCPAQAGGGPDPGWYSWAVRGTGQRCGSGYRISLGHL